MSTSSGLHPNVEPGETLVFSKEVEKSQETDDLKWLEEKEKRLVSQIYLGCLQPVEAQKCLEANSTFGLYHKSDGTIDVNLTAAMHIVYKTAGGTYSHFAIETIHLGGKMYYRVERDETSPNFTSLGRLVQYYLTYCLVHKKENIEALPV